MTTKVHLTLLDLTRALAFLLIAVSLPGRPVYARPDALDPTFAPALNGPVYALAIQQDGRILIGGAFTVVSGTNRSHLARLYADGTLDLSFDPGNYPGRTVYHILVQTNDGRILANVRDTIVRLNTDGTPHLLVTNTPPLGPTGWSAPRLAGNSALGTTILDMALDRSGRVIIGGTFGSVFSSTGFVSRPLLARLQNTGALDLLFNPRLPSLQPIDASVQAVAVESDGRILAAGGYIATLSGEQALLRLSSALGSIVEVLVPSRGNYLYLNLMELQPDGRILIAGSESGRLILRRLNTDLTDDTHFTSAPSGSTYGGTLSVQSNGRVLFSDNFGSELRRLKGDGSVDAMFMPEFAPVSGQFYWINAVAPQADGKILVGGNFATVNGLPRPWLARFEGLSDARFESIARLTDGTIRLTLGGEPGRTYLIQGSTNLHDWTDLTSLVAPSGSISYTDATGIGLNRRFYRSILIHR